MRGCVTHLDPGDVFAVDRQLVLQSLPNTELLCALVRAILEKIRGSCEQMGRPDYVYGLETWSRWNARSEVTRAQRLFPVQLLWCYYIVGMACKRLYVQRPLWRGC